MNTKREYAFDLLRVIAMIMVIVIHVSNVYSRNFGIIDNSSFLLSLFYNTISRISVPIFFMISGSLLLDKKINIKKYIKRLLKFILLIIVWDIIYLIWEYFYLGITYDKFYMLIIEPYRAHLWFLYTILIIYIFQPLMWKILEKLNKPLKILLLVIWLSLSTASIFNSTIAQIFSIFSSVGFFILGKYIYDWVKNNDLRKYNLLFVLIMILSYIVSITLNYVFSLKYNQFYNLFFAYRTPFIILASFSFFILIVSNYKKDTINKMVIKLSDLSLGVYLIHGIFLDITVNIFMYNSLNSIIGIPIFSIIIFILSVISVSILKKIKVLKKII